MVKRIVFDEPAIGRLVSRLAQCPYNPDTDHSVGVVDDSHSPESPEYARGGVLYTFYTGASIMVHIGGVDRRWATRDVMWAMFHYPFVQLGCKRVYALVEANNEHGLSVILKAGFYVQAVLPDLFASGTGLVVCMERDQCRWLRVKPITIAPGGVFDDWSM